MWRVYAPGAWEAQDRKDTIHAQRIFLKLIGKTEYPAPFLAILILSRISGCSVQSTGMPASGKDKEGWRELILSEHMDGNGAEQKRLTGSLQEDMTYLNAVLEADKNFDIIYRVVQIGGREACMYLVDGFCKDDLVQKLLQYFMDLTADKLPQDMHGLSKQFTPYVEVDLEDPAAANFIGEARWQALREEVELLGAGRDFDMKAVRAGTLSPVFFGSALTNFGVEPFLEEFLRMTTPPTNRVSDAGEIDAFSPDFSAFVFKIQANMNKAHRDRIAFMRVCSGKFQRDSEVYHMQSGKKLRLSQPQQMLAAEREIIDEAYAGDIIGVFDPGLFAIGDTVTAPGKKFKFQGIPTFEPEHFMRVSPVDTMKRKQFIKGTEQIAQEGAIQIFKVPYAGMEEVIVGVVGTLQFDVFQYRMRAEYGVELRMNGLPYDHLRRIAASPVEPKDLTLCADAALLEDFRGRSLIAYSGEWPVGYLLKHNPGLELEEPN